MAKSTFKLDKRQKILICAAVAIVISGLCPPWITTWHMAGEGNSQWSAGYGLIFFPPEGNRFEGIKLDTARLFVEWVCILAASGAAWEVVRLNRKRDTETEHNPF